MKVYHPNQWHCCTGTFSQVTADYGISAYFHDAAALYVNLYVPSRVQCSSAQRVWRLYSAPAILIRLQRNLSHTSATHCIPVYLRIPAWAGPKTSIAVNGKRILSGPKPASLQSSSVPGRLATISRSSSICQPCWSPWDAEHPNLMAAVHDHSRSSASAGAIPAHLTPRRSASRDTGRKRLDGLADKNRPGHAYVASLHSNQ